MGRRSAARGVKVSALLAGLAVAGAGCVDMVGLGSRFDPDRTLDQLDTVLRPLDEGGDFLLGLDLVVATLDFFGGGLVAEVLSPRPERWAERRTGASDGRRELLRSLPSLSGAAAHAAGSLGSAGGAGSARSAGPAVNAESAQLAESAEGGPGAFRIPFGIRGETLAWDRNRGYVVTGRSGAPSDGVRFFLYRMSAQTGYPETPLTLIGYLDLTDEDGSQVEAVRVRAVRTLGSDRVIADYRVGLTGSGTFDEGSIRITTRGFVGDGATVELDLAHRFTWSLSADRDDLTLDYRYRRGSRSVELGGHATSRFEAPAWATFVFGVALRGTGPTTDIEADIRRDGSVHGEILSDGRRVVRIRGFDGSPRFERVDGARMTGSEEVTLEHIWAGITDLIRLTEWVMIPADLLLASG